jgi:hypothetical protein
MNAVIEIGVVKADSEKVPEVVTNVSVVQAEQTIASRSWGLLLLFRAKNGDNVFTVTIYSIFVLAHSSYRNNISRR